MADMNRILLLTTASLSLAAVATGGIAIYQLRQVRTELAGMPSGGGDRPQWASDVMMQAGEAADEAQKAARAASRAEEAAQKACKAVPGYLGEC